MPKDTRPIEEILKEFNENTPNIIPLTEEEIEELNNANDFRLEPIVIPTFKQRIGSIYRDIKKRHGTGIMVAGAVGTFLILGGIAGYVTYQSIKYPAERRKEQIQQLYESERSKDINDYDRNGDK
jgi:hypothetical protein